MFYNNGYNQDWSTLKKLIWLRGNPATGQMGTDLTVSGTPPLSLPNSLGKPLKAWEVGLEPYQDLHGYDSPWPAGGGKNKFNPAEAQSGKWINTTTGAIENSSSIYWITGYIPVKSGDTVYCSPSKGSSRNAWFNSDKTQSTYQTYGGGGAGVIAPADGYFVATVTNDRFSIDSEFVVTINNSDLTYSPYSNICPIHGTDRLTITTSGANLCNPADIVVTPNSASATVYNGGLRIAISSSQNVTCRMKIGVLSAGTYFLKVNSKTSDGDAFSVYLSKDGATQAGVRPDQGVTFTADGVAEYGMLFFGNNSVSYYDVAEIMLNFGSTALPYQPYIAPSQTVIDVPPLSANQWDEEWELGSIGNDGSLIPSTARIRSKNYIKVVGGETYRLVVPSVVTSETIRMAYYKADKTFIEMKTFSFIPQQDWTFTPPSDCVYIMFRTPEEYGTTYNHGIAINYPSTVTTYNPYNATVYTGTIGSDGGESRWGEVDLGTLEYGHRTSNNREIFETTIIDMKTITSSTVPFEGMCEIYRSVSNNAPWVNNDISYGSINTKLVDIVDNRFDNVNDFKAAVSGVKLIYPLDTPTAFAVPSATIPTPRGSATTWATAENGTVDGMEVTYVGKA